MYRDCNEKVNGCNTAAMVAIKRLVVRVRGDMLTSSRRVGFSIVNLFSTGAKR